MEKQRRQRRWRGSQGRLHHLPYWVRLCLLFVVFIFSSTSLSSSSSGSCFCFCSSSSCSCYSFSFFIFFLFLLLLLFLYLFLFHHLLLLPSCQKPRHAFLYSLHYRRQLWFRTIKNQAINLLIHLFIRLYRSLVHSFACLSLLTLYCSPHTTCLACALRCAHLFACSHPRPQESEWLNVPT